MNKRTAILDLDYNLWAPRVRLDTMKYYQFTYPGKQLFFHQVAIADSTQFAVYVMKDGKARKIYVVEADRVPVYYSWTNQPKGYSFYIAPEKRKEITLRLYDRVLILDSMCFDAHKKTIMSLDLDHLPEWVYVHPIAPKIEKTFRRREKITWVFTETEMKRHTQYLAAFRGMLQPAYLEAGREFVPVFAGDNNWDKFVVGPIMPGRQTYHERRSIETTYSYEGGFYYAFEGNIVYKMEPPRLFPDRLEAVSYSPMQLINDVAINKKFFLEVQPQVGPKWHPQVIDLGDYACRVKMLLPREAAQSGVASILFQDCKTGVPLFPCRAQTGRVDYFTLPRGWRHAVVLYNNGTYLKMDSINLQPHYNIVADMSYKKLQAADPASAAWLASPAGRCWGESTVPPPRIFSLTRAHNAVGNVHGTILDDTNMPLPGAVVMVKGTAIGAVADVYGNFIIDLPDALSTLIVSFIGYKTKEIEISIGSELSVVMEPDITALSEVVVVGYGTEQKKENLSYSAVRIRGAASIADALAGKVAGVTMSTEDDTREETAERSDSKPEQQLYQELLTLKNIRSQFSDVGFWEPRLFTDRHGQAKFTITFPDDITRWNAVVYGMNRQLQTGTARRSIQSYKPVMAELHVPQFLTVGDSAFLLGKVLNYTADKSIQGKTQWNGAVPGDITFGGFHSEKRSVVVASADTLATSYSFTRDDGYFDGESRKVPVVEQGTIRANGSLSVLKNGDELVLKPGPGKVVKVEMMENPLDIYAGDVQYLLHYKYDCNEQLASKLMGFLNYRMLARYEDRPFEYDKDVNKIIQRLLKNQNSEFLWSWWDVSSGTSYWMSAHILRALKAARDAGYAVRLDLDNMVRKATYKYDYLHGLSLSDLATIHALAMWDAKIDYARYASMMDRQIRNSDSLARADERAYGWRRYSWLNEKLLLYEVRQLQGLPLVRDSLLRYKKQTILDEVYFSDGRPSVFWHAGDLSNNSIAYRIIKRDSTMHHLSTPMQMYFLSLRRKGSWNTYEASNVLYSILPDLIAQGSSKKFPASVSLSGKVNEKITQFPYKFELQAGEALQIRKDTGLPLYFMQYEEERVTTPQAGTDAFKIQTEFSEKSLKAGKPVVLKTTIEVERDAKLEHVMIEIPIPGACSYADKRQYHNAIETHREYFKEKTVIFCERMTAGTYVFQVYLLPRFTGTYHVNPAQVSLMYFPVINANTGLEKIRVGE